MTRAPDKTPIILLSGFLGSGKTTLLNGWLRDPAFANTAVVINELGEIGLDQLLVETVEDNVALLAAGCLCCGLAGSLRDTLLDLHARRLHGRAPPFQRVIIETTGLADPAPIIQALIRDRLVTDIFAFEQLVTVVDALFGASELERHREARQQVLLADTLVLSKVDLAEPEAVVALRATLRAANPAAPIAAAPGSIADVLEAPVRIEFEMAHDHAHHDGSVREATYIPTRPINWAGVAAWSEMASGFFGAKLLRCKGLLEVRGASGPVLIQAVQGLFAPPRTLPGWPDADHRSRLVLITQDLDPGLLRASLDYLHIESGMYRPASIEEMLAGEPV